MIKNLFIIFVSFILCAYLLLVAVFSLPADKIADNGKKSIEMSLRQEQKEAVLQELGNTVCGNDFYTDRFILKQAFTELENESKINKVINLYFYDEEEQLNSYSRYWSGQLVFIKPLLLIFDYQEIQKFNFVLQNALLLILLYLIYKNLRNYFIPFFLALTTIKPFYIHLSLTFSSTYYLLLIASIVLLKFKNKILTKNNLIYFFFISGCLNAFFDYLNYPLITLGFTLILVLLSETNKNNYLKTILKLSCSWFIGYTFFWCAKFITASIITKETEHIINGFGSFFTRIAHNDKPYYIPEHLSQEYNSLSIFDSIFSNLNELTQRQEILFFIIGIIFLINIILIIKNYKKSKTINFKPLYPFLIIATFPFVWLMIFVNHSYIHSYITFRIFAVSIFALLASITKLRIENQKENT